MPSLTTDRVLAAADRRVEAIAATDTEASFACFAESASFVFHSEGARFDDRAVASGAEGPLLVPAGPAAATSILPKG